MASNPAATLSSLLRSATIDDHEEILKAANAVLKTSKNDPKALHTRVIALLNLDRFEDALRALDEGGDKLSQECVLEQAYALYKTGKLVEAEELARGVSSSERGLKHVAAQVAYRAEKFEDAARIYKELNSQKAPIEGEENDLRINSAAVDAQLEWQENGDKVEPSRKKATREDLEAFETAYNSACACIARGELSVAAMLLKRARDLCEASDELSDEDKKAEILPIMVQQAFVLTKMGKAEDAEAIQKMINVAEVPELPSRAIAQNNELAASIENSNPYLTERVFESMPKLKHSEKHFEYQASILRRNRYVVDLQAQKFSGVAHSTSSIISKSPSPTLSSFVNSISVLNAAAHTHGATGKAGLKQVLLLLEKRPNDVGLMLTIIQLYVLTNNPGPAIDLLESFFKRLEESSSPADQDVRFAPGLIAVMVSLYKLSGRKESVKAELEKAASYWRRKSKPAPSLLRAAGFSLLPSSNPEDLKTAGEIFASLREQDANDRIAVAGMVASYATTDFSKISSDLDKLPQVDRLIAGIDVEALEEAGVASIVTQPSATTSKKRSAAADAEKEKPAKKRHTRKSKLPKDYEEGKKMDPERWLPLRDRSSYRPKGKKGKKKAADATQGGVVKEEESLELVGGSAIKVEKAPPGGGSKNKKKKGKK
ncbi:hypothetical protein F5884DRAFT_799947 [Xylogone sp. PMI_703]|nr:hypothetical protein F5884DRAFT_799947 [Xylogone sp. PMI_703]